MKTHHSQSRLSCLTPGWRLGWILLFAAMPLARGAAPEPTQGLVLSWHLDETTGLNAGDNSGNGNNGTLMNYLGDDTQWVTGKVGGSLALNYGSMNNNYIQVSNLVTLNSTTWSAWVKLTTTSLNYDAAISAGFSGATAGHSLGFHTGATALQPRIVWNHNVAATIIQSPTPVVGDAWNHLALTYDANAKVLKLFLNGEEKASTNNAATTAFSSVNIGRRQASASNPFRGVIDEVRIFNRALSLSEVQHLAGQVVAGPPQITQPPNPVLAYEGQSAIFTVTASGQSPLAYQWLKNGLPVSGATNISLTMTNLSSAQSGAYSVVVTNAAGSVTSPTAQLTVTALTNINVGLVANWKLDDGSGLTAKDSSPNKNAGQLLDFADTTSQWVAGKVSGALQFDGVFNRVVVPDSSSLRLGNEASFSFWINPAGYGSVRNAGSYNVSEGRIIRKNGTYDIYTSDNPGGAIKTIVANGVNAKLGSLDLSVWQHFAVVFRAGTVAFYKNGFPLGGPQAGALSAASTNNIVLGNNDEGVDTPRFYQGLMDEVGVWERPLGESEVLTLAGKDSAGPPAIDTPPQALTKLEGTSAEFLVLATGKRPIAYQWYRNNLLIANATNNNLALSTLTTADAGYYTVLVSNALGQIICQPAALVVQQITNISAGLLAYWNFDEISGMKLRDASNLGHDATLQGNPAAAGVSGQIGGAFSFDGVNDFAVVPHSSTLNLTDDATISFWLNPQNYGLQSGGYGRILRKTVNYDVALNSTLQTFMFAGVNKAFVNAATNAVELNVWQHLALVIRNNAIEFFKNGQSLGPAQPAQVGSVNTDPLIIGNFQSDLAINRLYTGLMDDLGLWNRALTAREINGVYQNALAGKPLNTNISAPNKPLNLSLTLALPNLIVSWPNATDLGFVLEGTDSLQTPIRWAAASLPVVTNGVLNIVTIPTTNTSRFYRLRQ